MADRAGYDQNLQPTLLAVSTADGVTPVTLEADPTTHALVTSGSGGGGGGAVTVADGADVTQGAVADAAVTAGSTGSVSGKLRTISADLSVIKGNQTNATQKTQVVDGSGNIIASTGNALNVNIASGSPTSAISTNNSSTATLLSGAAFTGTGEDVTAYSEMRVSVFANVASGTDGLSLQQSSDNTNWDVVDTYTVAAAGAGQGKTYVVPRQERYFRVAYTNGGTNQTTFRLQTILNRQGTAPSSQRPGDAYTNETDLVQNQSFLMGYNGTTWDRLRTTGTGVLTVSAVLTAGAATIGAISNTSFTATQATGTNLHTVLDSGTLTTLTTLTGTTSLTPGVAATNLGKAEDAAHTTGDVGVFALTVRNDGAATTPSNANADYQQASTDAKGRTIVVQAATTSSVTSVASSATSVSLLASNTARTAATFYNDSTAICYLKLGATASATSYTIQMAANSYYEVPGGYVGAIDGIWASANGNMRITEIS